MLRKHTPAKTALVQVALKRPRFARARLSCVRVGGAGAGGDALQRALAQYRTAPRPLPDIAKAWSDGATAKQLEIQRSILSEGDTQAIDADHCKEKRKKKKKKKKKRATLVVRVVAGSTSQVVSVWFTHLKQPQTRREHRTSRSAGLASTDASARQSAQARPLSVQRGYAWPTSVPGTA
eukprot:1590402-Rhodomonas_salina.1